MIFVTVGHQLPFDRLVRAVDAWAPLATEPIVAQVGESTFVPEHLESHSFMTPGRYDECMREASAIVGHAGTGTIIAAVRLGKPLLVLPRLSRLGETRNDHQVATARYFEDAGYVLVATTEDDLPARLAELHAFRPRVGLDDAASEQLIERLRAFSFGESA